MRAVGIKTLKNKLSEYVRLAAGGETVLVTDRDRVVAELGPPSPGRSEVLQDARLAEAMRKGWIRAPREGGEEVPPSSPDMKFADIMTDLEWSRRDRE